MQVQGMRRQKVNKHTYYLWNAIRWCRKMCYSCNYIKIITLVFIPCRYLFELNDWIQAKALTTYSNKVRLVKDNWTHLLGWLSLNSNQTSKGPKVGILKDGFSRRRYKKYNMQTMHITHHAMHVLNWWDMKKVSILDRN